MFKQLKELFGLAKKLAKKPSKTLCYEELEQRVLFSADVMAGLECLNIDEQVLVEDVIGADHIAPEAASAGVEQAAEAAARELVFIDRNVPDYEQLILDLQGKDANRTIEVVVLEADRDGIAQVGDILAERSDLAAVHFVTHGTEGQISLGSSWLNSTTLQQNSDAISAWGNALTETGDFLFYGCKIAAGSNGQTLLNGIAKLTGADVAASDDLTGRPHLGGDWDLEHSNGKIETAVAFNPEIQQNWNGVLATFTVNTTDDSIDDNLGDGNAEDAAGNTSLRAAIMEANALGGAHEIILNPGTYRLTLGPAGDEFAMSGDLDVTSELTVTGSGADVTFIDGNSLDRVFHIKGATASLTLTDLTVMGGSIDNKGGGVLVDNATAQLTATRVIITGNIADDGAGIFNRGIITLTDVVISNNGDATTNEGGGIHNKKAAILNGVTLAGNHADKVGGVGGGIHNDNTSTNLSLTNVTFSGNTADSKGGGLHTQTAVTILNSTFTLNAATTGGGISNNIGTVNIKNAIVAENLASSDPDVEGAFNSQGNNLIADKGTVSDFTDGVNGDQVGTTVSPVDPMLDVLWDNGGFTATHALLAGSPAIDAGDNSAGLTADQRGSARPIDGDGNATATIDIGAFEYGTSGPYDASLWLKADTGVTTDSGGISQWDNQVSNPSLPNLQQSQSGERPDFVAQGLNFNPVISFNGVDDDLRDDSVLGSDLFSSDQMSIFTVQNFIGGDVIVQWSEGAANRASIEGSAPRSDFGDQVADRIDGTGGFTGIHIFNSQAVPGGTVTQEMYVDGGLNATEMASSGSPFDPSPAARFRLGERAHAIDAFQSQMQLAEVIIFDHNLTDTERNQVETYLAVKYGITLNQTLPTDYTNYAGTAVWNAATNAGYANDIAGIGRDDLSSLHQTQSRSINSDAIVTMSAASSMDDGDYLLWSNDNSTLAETGSSAAPGVFDQLGRVWRVSETGDLGTTTISFDVSALAVTGTVASDFRLIIDTDTDFSGGSTLITASSFTGGVVTFTGVNLSDGEFFALGTCANNAPIAMNLSSTSNYNEGDATVAITDIVVSDVDTGETITATLTLTDTSAGSLSANDGATYTAGTGVWTITDTVANVNTALANLVFNPNINNDVDTTISVVIDDGDEDAGGPLTGTITLDVTPANDPPVLGNNDLTITEGATVTLDSSMLSATDVDHPDPSLTFNVSGVTAGHFAFSSDTATPITSFDQSDITAGTVVFVHDGSETPPGYSVSVTDGTDSTAAIPANITFTNLDDPPMVVTNAPLNVPEETTRTITTAYLETTDPDNSPDQIVYTLTMLPSGGSVRLNGSTLTLGQTFTQDDINNNRVTYRDSDNGDTTSFQMTVSDGNTTLPAFSFGINGQPINDAPVVFAPGSALNATEQVGLAIQGTGIGVSDPDEAGAGALATLTAGEGTISVVVGNSGVSVDSGDGTGTVTLSGSIAQFNALLTGTSTGTITYLNTSDTPGANTTLTVTVNDQGNTGSDPGLSGDGSSEEGNNSVTINIASVNDAPVNSIPGSQSTSEDTPLVFSSIGGNLISIANIDAGGTPVDVTLSVGDGTLTLNGTTGLVFNAGDGTADATMTFTGTVADINDALDGLTYTPDPQWNGAVTLTLTTSDRGNTGLTPLDSDANLTTRYSFDVDGTDAVGGNDATLFNGAGVTADGERGNVLGLDGVDDYAEVPVGVTDGLSQFTFSFWVKTTESGTHTNFWQRPALFGMDVHGASNDLVINTNNGFIGIFTGLSGTEINYLSSTTQINDDEWHQITVSNDGANASLYVDGVFEVALASGNGLDSYTYYLGAQNFEGTVYQEHGGSFDDLRIFDRGLASTEVLELYTLSDTDSVAITVNSVNDPGTVTIDNTTPAQGDTLTASVTDPEGATGAIAYQWYRGGVAIAGATSSTYTTVQADVGSAITVTADYTDDLGSAESPTSASTAAVTNVNDPGSVTIDNTTPAQGDTLTASVNDADGATGAISYQWYRGGVAIAGETASIYTTVQADVGAAITVTATYSDDLGSAESPTSSATALVTNVNDPGAVTIDNTNPAQGDTLTASVSDADGATGAISYQWYRGGAAIAGATASTYTTVQADVGAAITVTATYSDDLGSAESPTSAATALVTNVNDPGAVTIDNTNPAQGDTLTASVSDADGATGAISYQWYRGGVAIAGATASTYTTVQADVGAAITVTATYSDDLGSAESPTSAATALVTNVNDPGAVTIDNTNPAQGDTLTASVSDADGSTGAISYQWYRGGVAIAGATASTYTTVQADVGAAITVTATYSDDLGSAESPTSAATALVTNVNDPGSVTIDNTNPAQGDTLTASVSDPDGATGAISYQWYRGGVAIAGATSSTYTTVQADVGSAITVTANYTDDLGSGDSPTSAPTAAVTNVNDPGSVSIDNMTPVQGDTLTASVSDADGATGAISYQWYRGGVVIAGETSSTYTTVQADVGLAITVTATYNDDLGSAESPTSSATALVTNVNDPGAVTIDNTNPAQGDTLTASVSDADGATGAISYQWYRGGVAIAGATSSTYTTVQADVGAAITVTANYTDDLGSGESPTSAPTAAVTNVNDPGSVSIDNMTPVQGDTLTASVSDADGTTGAISYQWYRGGVAIAGATSSTYTTVQADVGSAITVTATYTDDLGSAESPSSPATAAVTNVNDPGSVTIDNSTPAQGNTLTADVVDPDGISGAIAYQWYRGGTAIAGATGKTYTTTQADVGAVMAVTADYTDDLSSVESLNSPGTAPVTNVNDSPVAVNDNLTVNEDNSINFASATALLGNDSDIDGDALTMSGIAQPANGTLVDNGDGSLTYTPDGDFYGIDSFTYSISDGKGGTASGTAMIVVAPVGDTPQVTHGSTFPEMQSGLIFINRNANDGPEVTHLKISGITNGTLHLADGVTQVENGDYITVAQGHAGLRFTPAENSLADGSFNVESSEDGVSVASQSGIATSNITVMTPALPPLESEPNPPQPDPEPKLNEEETQPESQVAEDVRSETGGTVELKITASVTTPQDSIIAITAKPVSNAGASPQNRTDFEREDDRTIASSKQLFPQPLKMLLEARNVEELKTALAKLEVSTLSPEGYALVRNSLDAIKEEIGQELLLGKTVVGSAIATSVGLSAGYVVWLLKGGSLMASVLSSLPAWRFTDPLAILVGKKDDQDDDDESLETIIEDGSGRDEHKELRASDSDKIIKESAEQ